MITTFISLSIVIISLLVVIWRLYKRNDNLVEKLWDVKRELQIKSEQIKELADEIESIGKSMEMYKKVGSLGLIDQGWLARDKDLTLLIFSHKPVLSDNGSDWTYDDETANLDSAKYESIETIEHLGESILPWLTFENSPIPIKGELFLNEHLEEITEKYMNNIVLPKLQEGIDFSEVPGLIKEAYINGLNKVIND